MFTTSLRNKFTKMKYQLRERVNDNLLKQNLILERKGTGNEQYIGDNAQKYRELNTAFQRIFQKKLS